MGFPSVPAGPFTSDNFLVWRSYSSVETNFSQDILAQDDLMELVHVLRKKCTLVQCHDVWWRCQYVMRLMIHIDKLGAGVWL